MILLVHMVFGAAAGYISYTVTNNLYFAIIIAFLSHYLLDIFPHIEYSIENIRYNNWKNSLPDIIKVLIDFSLAVLIIFWLRNNYLIYAFAFVSTIPDGLTVISRIFPNKILSIHDKIHTEKIHYLTKQKKFPIFWRILSQVIVVIISIIILIF